MSLRTFHVIFIICSILLAIVFGSWAIRNFWNEQSYAYLFTGIGSFVTAVGLLIYEVMFIRKVKA